MNRHYVLEEKLIELLEAREKKGIKDNVLATG